MKKRAIRSMLLALAVTSMSFSGVQGATKVSTSISSTVNLKASSSDSTTSVSDLKSYVTGIKNIKVEKGTKINYLEGVSFDKNRISKISVDSRKVDVNKLGDYKVYYKIVGKNGVSVKLCKHVNVVNHIHKWKTRYEIIHHKEVTHLEYQMETVQVWYFYLQDHKCYSREEAREYVSTLPDDEKCPCRYIYEDVPKEVVVVDKEAWNELRVITYCSSCGKIKSE